MKICLIHKEMKLVHVVCYNQKYFRLYNTNEISDYIIEIEDILTEKKIGHERSGIG